jgi:hypothetical protein
MVALKRPEYEQSGIPHEKEGESKILYDYQSARMIYSRETP